MTKNSINIKTSRIVLIRRVGFQSRIWLEIKKINLVKKKRVLSYFRTLRINQANQNLNLLNKTLKKNLEPGKKVLMEKQLKSNSMLQWEKQLK